MTAEVTILRDLLRETPADVKKFTQPASGTTFPKSRAERGDLYNSEEFSVTDCNVWKAQKNVGIPHAQTAAFGISGRPKDF